ncbi:hypothetical protein NQ318_015824, partial [Aromia moschata]
EPPGEQKRDSRQFIIRGPALPVYNPFAAAQGWGNAVGEQATGSGPCFTSKGVLGKCVSFRQCYPYFKQPEGNGFENWAWGMYDTCSYYTQQGRQMFGVCCSKPTEAPDPTASEAPTIESEEKTDSNSTLSQEAGKQTYYPQVPSWPPPLPTHPRTTRSLHCPSIPPLPVSRRSHPVRGPNFETGDQTYEEAGCHDDDDDAVSAADTSGVWGILRSQEWISGPGEDRRRPQRRRQLMALDRGAVQRRKAILRRMSSWDVARLTVRLGDHNIRTNSEIKHVEKRVKRVVRHKGFDPRTLFAVTQDKLRSTTHSSRNGTGILRRTQSQRARSVTYVYTGKKYTRGPQPAILQEVNIPIWSNRDCKLKYGPAAPGGIVDHMLCAGQTNRDSCSGDSGGPLMINNGKWTQVGIVSWGIGCGKGQYPAFTRKWRDFYHGYTRT